MISERNRTEGLLAKALKFREGAVSEESAPLDPVSKKKALLIFPMLLPV